MGKKDDLYITVPTFFRCPISLDVMKSPVSLCTGVTYDRSSIQRWLENGNNTCPATMQVLDNKDFVPNHTLERLIQIWSNNRVVVPHSNKPPQFHSLSSVFINDLIKHLMEIDKEKVTNEGMFESFVKILCFASESAENRRFLGSSRNFVDYLVRIVASEGPDLKPDLLEAVLKILQLIVSSSSLKGSSCGLVSALARIIKTGPVGSKAAAAGIVETLSQDPDTKKLIADHQELVFELLQILKQETIQKQTVLSCLISIASARRNKQKLVRAGVVRVIGDVMSKSDDEVADIEQLLTLLELVAGCTEGRNAISDDPNCVSIIIHKLMKVSKVANEHGITLLWSLCYLFRDQRAKEAVMRSNGGLTKILLLMQSDCSPAVKKMCCDLLRIFRVNSKSCLSSYDTKTTHIMPC